MERIGDSQMRANAIECIKMNNTSGKVKKSWFFHMNLKISNLQFLCKRKFLAFQSIETLTGVHN